MIESRTRGSEFLAYALASAAALGVDGGLLSVLVGWAHWNYLLAAATSFVCGGIFLYFISVRVVFRFRRINRAALELPLFVGLGAVGLFTNVLVMYIAVEGAHIHYLIAKGAAAACTFITNYLLRRHLLFAQPQPVAGRAGR
jgi:putative flippase GtrA